jgi:hypothetical protein
MGALVSRNHGGNRWPQPETLAMRSLGFVPCDIFSQKVRAPNMAKNENFSEQDNLTESKLIDPSEALKLTTQAGLDPAPC